MSDPTDANDPDARARRMNEFFGPCTQMVLAPR